MSPLIFVLGMKYLSKLLMKVGTKEDFKFHERCGKPRLNHLCFADDVILFCHGDYVSIYRMLQGLKLFSNTSGLQPSDTKSSIYCCQMNEHEVNRVAAVSGFSKSSLPFKYLGIPVCARQIPASECLAEANGLGLVAWDEICRPKKAGGLGFRRVQEWNEAAIGKYVWAVETKQDSLWIKWVHVVYLEQKKWKEYEAPTTSSWYWK
uniref:Reverse transcriptase domain-containing protein n=1 Tax=Cannabis sativa TaxID=3483 RepID=A0A803QQN4_CANSA